MIKLDSMVPNVYGNGNVNSGEKKNVIIKSLSIYRLSIYGLFWEEICLFAKSCILPKRHDTLVNN